MKRNFAQEIRQARIVADISQAILAFALGRSQFWLSAAERGKARVNEEIADHILVTIDRLGGLKKKPSESAALRDLRLPSRIESANQRVRASR